MIPQPIAPMLARSVAKIPVGDYAYEPKWDGYRCLIIRDGDSIELASRGKKPLTRYFPEVVEAARSLPERCIVDGELIVVDEGDEGSRLSWELLSQRIHPAESRIARLSVETPAQFVAFDLLWLDEDLTGLPFRDRRERLERMFTTPPHPSLHLTTITADHAVATQWFTRFEGAGLDGIIAKPAAGTYRQGKRDMLKIKHKRTAEAVVVGYRVAKGGHGVGSLLLGLYDGDTLRRVGGIVGLPNKVREELGEQLEPLRIDEPGPGLEKPVSRFGGQEEWVPLDPQLVVEVEFDQLEGDRFRHAVSLVRWRPDRDPRSCTLDQVDRAVAYDLADVLDA
ncbi:MAG: ATP-dependent DNA ligase [Propionibacterium sp.]|nr:ATP-dependent DNA ligase [Propionibacterium sp.]